MTGFYEEKKTSPGPPRTSQERITSGNHLVLASAALPCHALPGGSVPPLQSSRRIRRGPRAGMSSEARHGRKPLPSNLVAILPISNSSDSWNQGRPPRGRPERAVEVEATAMPLGHRTTSSRNKLTRKEQTVLPAVVLKGKSRNYYNCCFGDSESTCHHGSRLITL